MKFLDKSDVPIEIDASNSNQISTTSLVEPTIFERISKLVPVNSVFIIFIFGVFAGPLGNFLFTYLLTKNVSYSFISIFALPYAGESNSTITTISIDLLISNFLWYVLFIYLTFSIYFLRKRLQNMKDVLIDLSADGKNSVVESFKMVSKLYPQLLIALGFLWIYTSSIPGLLSNGTLVAINAPIYILRSLIRSIIFASFFWMYISGLWGLYRFGEKDLILKSCHIDNFLGLRDLGSLSFYFSRVYLVGLGIYMMHVFFGSKSGHTASINSLFLLILPLLGLIFFFVPLLKIREKMVETKKNEIKKIKITYGSEISKINEPVTEASQLNRLLAYEFMERKVAEIATWPFEIPMVGKLAVISLSVTSIIIANYALAFLRTYGLL